MSRSIHEACQYGDLDTIRAHLESDPAAVDADDEHDWRPIFHAALWKQEAALRLLIEAGADVAAHDGYVLHYAGQVPGNKAIVALLIQYGALAAHVEPADELSRQLNAAVFLADAGRVEALLRLHPELTSRRHARGDQAIHHAARNGDTDIVTCLIEHGADPNARSNLGHTVLYCAGGHGHLETLEALLVRGADPSVACTAEGKTLLEWLAQYPKDPRYQPIIAALRNR